MWVMLILLVGGLFVTVWGETKAASIASSDCNLCCKKMSIFNGNVVGNRE